MAKTIEELRQPKVDEIKGLIERYGAEGRPQTAELCCWFLYDLLCHEPTADELAALNGGPIPESLQVGKGGWDSMPEEVGLVDQG